MNTIIFAVGSFGSKILVLFLTRLYTSNISPADSSTKELLEITLNFLLPIFTLSISSATMRYGLDKEYDKKQVYTGSFIVCTAGLVSLFIISPLFKLISFLNYMDGYLFLLLLYVCASAFRDLNSQFIRAKQMLKLYSFDGILTTLTLFIFNIIFISALNMGVRGFMLASILSDSLSALFLFFAGKAYKYLNKRYHLGKELQSSNKLRNIEQEISYKRYQDQKYATEMQEQTYKIELLKRNLWLLGSVLILGIAFSIFLYKWYKRRKDLQLIEARYQLQLSEKEVAELKMHQQELELQNVHNELATSRQEATSFAVFLKSRNELLDKIRGMVKEGYKMDAQAITPHLKKINAFISQSQSGDKTNSALLTNIDDKSNEFLQRLVAIHPKLTQGEKYLATLLRVNLSTKEISMLTGTTPKTINMNRYRLRKSLNLSSEEDLTDYLQNI